MSKFDHSAVKPAASRASGAVMASRDHDAAAPVEEGALPLHAGLEKAAADIALGMFQPVVISLVSVLALGFAAMKVALYLAG